MTSAPLKVLFLRIAILGILAGAGAPGYAEAPRVVVSIKPVHSLVAGVMTGVGRPALLIAGVASPHTYVLKPSDARLLKNADVIFLIGPHFEFFLAKVLLGVPAKVVALGNAPGVAILEARWGGLFHGEHGHHEHGHHEHGHNEINPHEAGRGGTEATAIMRGDPHVWLDVGNAQNIVREIDRALSAADAANSDRYHVNARHLIARLKALDVEIHGMLRSVAERPFFVSHDAYQYFAKRYGLTEAGALTVSPDRPPGAKRIEEIQAEIRRLGVVCFFAEPQFQPALIDTIIAATPARRGTLDAEGGAGEAGEEQYFKLMRAMALELKRCLGQASDS